MEATAAGLLPKLLRWGTDLGVKADALCPANDGARSIIAKEALEQGRCFLHVPYSLLLHPRLALEDARYGVHFGQLQKECGSALDDRSLLCLLLMVERCKEQASLWHLYIKLLPQKFDDPLWWRQEELELLKGTPVASAVPRHEAHLERLARWRDRLVQICREGGQPCEELESGWGSTKGAVLWAKSNVWSRAFNVKRLGDAGKKGLVLLPIGDMLDHNPSQHVSWHTGPTGKEGFHFITHTAIAQGSVVYSNYGHKSNGELILSYGFTVANNEADFFPIVIGLESRAGSEDSCRAAQRRRLLRALRLSAHHFLRRRCPLPAALLDTARVCLMPDAAAYQLLCRPPPSGAPRLEAPADSAAVPVAGGNPEAPGSTGVGIADHGQQGAQAEFDAAAGGKKDQAAEGSGGAVGEGGLGGGSAAEASSGGHPSPGSRALAVGELEVKPYDPASETEAGRLVGGAGCSGGSELAVLALLTQQLRGRIGSMAGGPDAAADEALSRQPGISYASRMALEYRAGQKEIVGAGLAALQERCSELLHRLSEVLDQGDATARVELGGDGPSDVEISAACNEYRGWLETHGVLSALAEELPSCSDAPGPPLLHSRQWGLRIRQPCKRGGTLAVVPRAAVLRGGSREELICALVVAAMDTGAGTWAAAPQAQQAAGLALQDNGAAVWHAPVQFWRAAVQPGLAVRLAAGDDMADTLGEALDGTPLEPLLQQECAQLGQDFSALQPALQRALQARGGGRAEREDYGQEQHMVELMGWASAVVERGAVPGPDGEGLALAPIVSAVPQELRGLAVSCQWEADGELRLQAECDLAAGTLLGLSLLEVGADSERLLVGGGPEALAWAHLQADAGGPALQQALGEGAQLCSTSYELCLSPPETDPRAPQRQALLEASTLGDTHCLTASTQLERVVAAVAVCSADWAELVAAGAEQLLQSAQGSGSEDGPAEDSLLDSPSPSWAAAVQEMELQDRFLASIGQNHKLVKAARKQLRHLLREARSAMGDGTAEDDLAHLQALRAGWRDNAELAAPLSGILAYRAAVKHVLDSALQQLSASKRPQQTDTEQRQKKHRKKAAA